MKFRTTYIVAVISVLCMAGCSRDPAVGELTGDGTAQVQIVSQTGHRTVGDYWYGDHIGVIVTSAPEGSGMAVSYRNVEYGTEADGETTAVFTAVDADETIVFDTDGSVTVAAYAPYSQTEDISILPGDNGVIAGSVASQKDDDLDWLYASEKTATITSPDVKFEFKHVMSKVVVSVLCGNGMTGSEIEAGSYSLSGLILDGAFDVAPDSETAGTAYTTGTSATDGWDISENCPCETLYADGGETVTGVTYTAIVYPHASLDALTFKATVNNLHYEADLTKSGIGSFESGKSYTFNLSLSQAGLNLSGCTVDDWDNSDYDGLTLSQGYNPNDLVLTYTLTDADTEVTLPLYSTVNCTVDWGDGTVETVTDTWPTHTYSSAGEYDVVIDGTVTRLNSNNIGSSATLLTAVKQWGRTGLTSMMYAFRDCTALASIPGDTRGSFANVTAFDNVFYNCSALTSIPANLLVNVVKASMFNAIFQDCSSLVEIPENLFANCTAATSFNCGFLGCASVKEIPANLFANNTKVTDFYYAFGSCTSLTSIPENLFANNTVATKFSRTFAQCSAIEVIPANLFANNTEVTDFFGVFEYLSGLSEIPANLFANNTKVTDFRESFFHCTGLTGESAYDLVDIDGVETKIHLYDRASYPAIYTAPDLYSTCYTECTGLDDYDDITAAGWNQ